jgi:hypothetical protein
MITKPEAGSRLRRSHTRSYSIRKLHGHVQTNPYYGYSISPWLQHQPANAASSVIKKLLN